MMFAAMGMDTALTSTSTEDVTELFRCKMSNASSQLADALLSGRAEPRSLIDCF